ncbi:alpha-tocopherol transfer protein-related [Holotrichia oblita]|uniref:Alpha-tocopherol transfer protein-related n=1 Tax=Holotrichia oblita TaxID=644536 RepID=A0ACB9TGV2_HOLOL|nr:alpha-tocopherol transfer protein-related [Holotrichia oblita]
MSIRPLSKELQAKAIAELNEKPERIPEDIEYIKEWLRKQPHLNAHIRDDQLILNYLRGCKFSLEKTKAKLDSLYTLKGMLPEFFSNRDPFRKEIQNILKLGLALPLPNTATPDGPRILLQRPVPDPNLIKMEDIFKVNIMLSDIMVYEDDQAMIGGLIIFNDVTGAAMSMLTHMSPSITRKALTYYQDAYPTRPKEMHFFNIPSFFDTIMSMMKPFMKQKMQDRIRVHNTSRIEEMYQYIPKSVLPTEYGGDAGPIQDLIDYWKKKVEDHAEWLKEDAKYVSNESRRIGTPKTATDLFGMEGSFRKLNVD